MGRAFCITLCGTPFDGAAPARRRPASSLGKSGLCARLCGAGRLMITRRLFVLGRVQGVFYRGWSVATARALGIRGWVRNRRDGSVEMLVQGEAEQVDAMIARCREGPPAARVDRVEVVEETEEAPADFEQRTTA